MLLNLLATNNTSIILLVVMGVLIVALFVGNFFMQKKQKKQAQETMSKMKVGDTVVTIGGIKGTIVDVNETDDTVVIETGMGDNKMTITMFKGAIQNVNPELPVKNNTTPVQNAEPASSEEETEKNEDVFSEAKADETLAEEVKAEDDVQH